MAQASRVLASSMDYNETLQRVARLAASDLADWCAVDVLGERGELERVAVHHADPEMLALAESSTGTTGRRWRRPCRRARGDQDRQVRGSSTTSRPTTLATFARDERAPAAAGRDGRPRRDHRARWRRPRARWARSRWCPHTGGRRLIEADLDSRSGSGAAPAPPSKAPASTPSGPASRGCSNGRCCRTRRRRCPASRSPPRYRPAGELNEVGGDFYDVVPCGGGGWMLVIGDVCGKGPEAASVTALARHTLRAVSMLEHRPGGDARATAPHASPAGARWPDVHGLPGLVSRRRAGAGRTLTVALGGHPRPCSSGPAEQAHRRRRARNGPRDGRPDHRPRDVGGAGRGADAAPVHRRRHRGGAVGARGARSS